MKKIDLLNKQIITIEDCSLVRCIFTDNLIYKEEDLRINLYLYINKLYEKSKKILQPQTSNVY